MLVPLLQDHIMDERRLLMEMDHPFILKLHDSFQDDRYCMNVHTVVIGPPGPTFKARFSHKMKGKNGKMPLPCGIFEGPRDVR